MGIFKSDNMKYIRSFNNKSTELTLIKVFKELNIKGWKRGYNVKGHPDFVFLKERVVIFTDGCFWHGHDCRNTKPKENESYWMKKLDDNVQRDIDITRRFENRGWKVIRIWECEFKKANYNILMNKLRILLE